MNNKSTEHPLPTPPALQPIKTATCPSLTGTSKISYKIATDSSRNIHFQIIKNSQSGHFSEEWIAYSDAKADFPIGPFSSVPLRSLYQNKSLNTPGFLLAALLNEGVVEKEPGKRLLFRTCPDDAFLAEMQKLIDAGSDLSDVTDGVTSSGRAAKSVSGVSAVVNSHTSPKNASRGTARKGSTKAAKSLFPAS